MGCTHYPLLRSTIKRLMGEEVTLVNPAYETAVELRDLLKREDLICDGKAAEKEDKYQFYAVSYTHLVPQHYGIHSAKEENGYVCNHRNADCVLFNGLPAPF